MTGASRTSLGELALAILFQGRIGAAWLILGGALIGLVRLLLGVA